jgi:hypothetical protein
MSSNVEDEYFLKEDAEKLHKLHVEREKAKELSKKCPEYLGVQWACSWLHNKHGAGDLADEVENAFIESGQLQYERGKSDALAGHNPASFTKMYTEGYESGRKIGGAQGEG